MVYTSAYEAFRLNHMYTTVYTSVPVCTRAHACTRVCNRVYTCVRVYTSV